MIGADVSRASDEEVKHGIVMEGYINNLLPKYAETQLANYLRTVDHYSAVERWLERFPEMSEYIDEILNKMRAQENIIFVNPLGITTIKTKYPGIYYLSGGKAEEHETRHKQFAEKAIKEYGHKMLDKIHRKHPVLMDVFSEAFAIHGDEKKVKDMRMVLASSMLHSDPNLFATIPH
ncbi:MAG: hypothetical protein J7K68_06140 [Candidatus Diapherotrites archaeon]|nr:hypothetical protein [Candidatus Diapherotrites archaeon]